MIIVSGTGRSGTSMWMQVLEAAGFQVLGERFPQHYPQSFKQLNPRGFHESTLRLGVNFMTNPDPATGAHISPEASTDLAVKVLTFGLRRTERRYIDRALLTVRSWRSFGPSFVRLMELDGGPLVASDGRPADPALWWFEEHMATLIDARERGYLLRPVAFERALAEPERVAREALRWLGRPCDVEAGVAAIAPLLSEGDEDPREDLPPRWRAALDTLYEHLAQERPLYASKERALARVRREMREARQASHELGPLP